jgi:DNA-directed RNA polymerase sigma subunit (sigma70/sigma32)
MARSSSKPTIQRKKHFSSRIRAEELKILLNDNADFSETKQYLDSLIKDALERFQLSDEQLIQLHHELLEEVSVAARRFLSSKTSMNADYKFSTYFTWYIAERVNRIEGLKRRSAN